MRVVLQDGTMDVPYEKFIFYIAVDNSIIATKDFNEAPDVLFSGRIAKYSTREKALKAMEMLRTEYLKYLKIDGGPMTTVNFCVQPNVWNIPKVFRFPADDEVEV